MAQKPTTYRMEILRNTFVGGEMRRTGEVVEVNEIDRNTFLHFAKAKDLPPEGPPVADQREKELTDRMEKRRRPKAPKYEVISADDSELEK